MATTSLSKQLKEFGDAGFELAGTIPVDNIATLIFKHPKP
jgi:hypothetical protein